MRAVNLIPPEERRGARAPLRAGALSYAVVAVLGLAVAGVTATVLTQNEIKDSESELKSLEAQQAVAEQRRAELAPYGEYASLSESRRATIASLAESRFDWQRVLRELALVIPDDVWLDSLSGAVAPGVAGGEGGGETGASDPSITGPSLLITGCGEGQIAVARFVAALRDIDGVTRVGMQRSELGDVSASDSSGSASSGGSSEDCQTREFIAAFDITIAFDAVPAPEYAAVPSAAATEPTDEPGGTESADGQESGASVGAGQ